MQSELFNLVKENFYNKIGLIVGGLLIVILSISTSAITGCGLLNGSIIVVSLLILWSIVWVYFQNRFPKTKKGQKGIYFAISSEKGESKEKIKLDNRLNNDIIKKIERFIAKFNLSTKIRIHTLNDFQKIKLTSILQNYTNKKRELSPLPINQELKHKEIKKFYKLNNSIKGSYFIWGDLRLRSTRNEPTYILQTIDGLVCHKNTAIDISKRLSDEFNKIIIRKFEVKEKTEEEGFEIYSKFSLFGMLYIVGIAALISGEFNLSIELLKIAKDFIENQFTINESSTDLQKNISSALSEALLGLADDVIKKEDYIEAKKINHENLLLMPNNSYIIHQRVLIEFYLKNNSEALKYNEKLKTKGNNCWLYNKGFLLMTNGNFQQAYNIYSQLLGSKFQGEKEFVHSCIDHDLLILRKNPNFTSVHFILGFLYYKKLDNTSAALEHFEAFNEKYEKSKNLDIKNFVKDSKKYIREINKILELKS